MADYVERHDYAHLHFGIEDYKVPGKHFLPEQASDRFHVWVNGAGIGYAHTIEEAHTFMRRYAKERLWNDRAAAAVKLAGIDDAIHTLSVEDRQEGVR